MSDRFAIRVPSGTNLGLEGTSLPPGSVIVDIRYGDDTHDEYIIEVDDD